MRPSPIREVPLGLAVAVLAVALAAPAGAAGHVDVGAVVPDRQLPTLDGGRHALVARTTANVLLFFRPSHERSAEALTQLAECERIFAGKPVHFAAVVSSSFPADEVRAAVTGAGVRSPILVDEGDALYGELGVRQHPLVLVADARGKVTAVQPYARLRYCEIIKARVRLLLGEVDQAQVEQILNPARSTFPGENKLDVAKRFVNLGKKQVQQGKCDHAVKSFDKALEIDPANAQAIAGKKACQGK